MSSSEINPYELLNRWLKDGNLKSPYPAELEDSKAISQVFFLNYFESSPKYFPLVNKLFNNFGLFSIPVKELCIQLKEMLIATGYRQPFVKRGKKADENKLISILTKKYPYYKKEEISMVVDFIDNSDDKEIIYEMFGLRTVKSKKLNAAEKKERKQKLDTIINSDNLLGCM